MPIHDDPARASSGDEDSESEGIDLREGFGLMTDTASALRLSEELGARISSVRDELKASMVNIGEDTEVIEKLQELSEALTEKSPSQCRKELVSSPAFESQTDSRPATPVSLPHQNIKELENQLHLLAQKKRGSIAVPAQQTSGGSTPPPEMDTLTKQIKELTSTNTTLTTELETLKKSTDANDRQRSSTRLVPNDGKRTMTPGRTTKTPTEQDDRIGTLESKLESQSTELNKALDEKASAVAVKNQIMTGLEAMRLENDELRNEREDLDRQIIALKLDNEDAESQISELQLEQKRSESQREEAKAAERRRIQAAATLLRKELSKESQKREEKYRTENTSLEEQVLALQEQLISADGGGGGGGGVSTELYHSERQKRRLLQTKLSDLNGNVKILCASQTIPEVSSDFPNSTISVGRTSFELDSIDLQDELINASCSNIASSILDGFLCCKLLPNTQSDLTSGFLQKLASAVVEKGKLQSEKGWTLSVRLSRDESDALPISDASSIPDVVEKCVDSSNTTTPTIYKLTVDCSNPQLGFDSHGEASVVMIPLEITNSIFSLLPSKSVPPSIQSLLQNGVLVSVLIPLLPSDYLEIESLLGILHKVREIEFGKPKKHVKRSR